MDNLEDILRFCDSITRNSLSYRTLSAPVPRFGDTSKKLYREKELAKWLDQRLLDYRVKAKVLVSSSQTSEDDLLKEQQALLDETTRQHHELLILRHVANSRIVKQVCVDEGHLLIRDCLRFRSKLGKQVAHLCQQLNDHRAIVKEKLRTFYQLEHETQQLWDEVKLQKEERQEGSIENESRLRKESRVLKLMFRDLLAGSKIDWCDDPRLLQCVCLSDGPEC